jgi:S-disulfanyl-L-cysteine oxidoreductase SoxD
MKFWLASCILTTAATAALAAQGGASRTVWDGVYTDAQASRGEKVSTEQCARCHGQTLTGAEAAPALVGDVFNANWEGVPLGDLFERIRVSMPLDTPGSLSRQQNVDVIAYLLKLGKVPAGAAELTTDTTVLGRITFVSNRP